MVRPVEGSGKVASPPPMSDMEEIHQLKLQIAKAKAAQRQADAQKAEAQASAKTEQARQNAKTALTTYNGAVGAHQKKWAQAHAGQYSTQAAAQAAWQKDWEKSEEGKAAWNALAPNLDAYDKAVANELRIAAENGGQNVKGAVTQKADELKGSDKSDSWEDGVLDGRVTKLQGVIANETPDARHTAMVVDKWLSANDRLTYAQGQQAEAQRTGALSVLEFWDREVIQAQSDVDAATTELASGVGGEFDGEAAKVLGVPLSQVHDAYKGMTNEQFDQVIKNLKAQHQGDALIGFLIEQVGQARRFDRDVTVQMKAVQATIQDIGNHLDKLTPLERKMWDQGDHATLAFLKLAGVTLTQGADGKLAITVNGNIVELSSLEQKLIQDDKDHDPDLRLLSLMLLGGIRIQDSVVNGKPTAIFTLDGDRLMPVTNQDGSIAQWLRFRDSGDGGWVPVQQAPDGSWVPMLKKDGKWVAVVKNQAGQWVEARKNDKGEWLPIDGATPLSSVKDLSGYHVNDQLLQLAASDATFKTLSNLGYSVLPYIALSPELKVLMGATSLVRIQDTKDQVQALLRAGDETGAMRALTTNMDAAFSPEERQRIWKDVGLTYLGYDFILKHIRDLTAKPNSDPTVTDPATLQARQDSTSYADKVGRWMQTILGEAPPEFANLLLDVVKDEATKDWQKANNSTPGVNRGLDFYKGLSKAVEMVPQRANEFASWLTNKDGAAYWVLPSLQQQSFLITVRTTMKEGYGEALSFAIKNNLAANEGASGRYSEFDQAVTIGHQEYGEHQAKTINHLQFEDFEANQGRIVNSYFNNLQNGKWEVTKFESINGHQGKYWLENFIGTAEGKTPTNLAASQAGDHNERWFTDPQDVMEIDLIAGWIRKESEDDWKIRAIPVIYASKRDGYTYGALFQLQRADGQHEVVIDGLAAPQLAAKALGNPDDKSDDKKLSDDGLQYKYTSLRNYQDENHLSEDGKLYLPYDLVTGMDPHGLKRFQANPNIGVIDAGYETGWEQFKFWGSVGMVVAGTIAAPFTGGGSLTMSAVGWSVIGLGVVWGIGVTIDDLHTMSKHGQTIAWSNPQARSAWIGLAGSLVGAKAVGLRLFNEFGVLNAFNRFSGNLALAGAIGNDSVRLQLGLAGLGFVRNTPTIVRAADAFAVATGGYLTVEQGSAMLANWDSMSDHEKFEAKWMFPLGVFQLGTGAWGLRHPMEVKVGANWKGLPGRRGPKPGANNTGAAPQPNPHPPGLQRIAGTGLQSDLNKKVFVGGAWYDKSTGEQVHVESSGDFSSPGDLVPLSLSDTGPVLDGLGGSSDSPTERRSQLSRLHQILTDQQVTRINVRGTGHESDQNVRIYVGGTWYNKATGEPVDMQSSGDFIAISNEPVRLFDESNGASTTQVPDSGQVHQWTPSENDITLTVGGGHAYRSALEGEVFLDISPDVQPDIVSDIRATPVPDDHFQRVYYDRFPYTVLRDTPAAFAETYRILRPGGSFHVTTGRGAAGAGYERVVVSMLNRLGFQNVRVRIITDENHTYVTFTGTKPEVIGASDTSIGFHPTVIGENADGTSPAHFVPMSDELTNTLPATFLDGFSTTEDPNSSAPLERYRNAGQWRPSGINLRTVQAGEVLPVEGAGLAITGLSGSPLGRPDVVTSTGQHITPVELMLALDRMERAGGESWSDADFILLGVNRGQYASRNSYTSGSDLIGRQASFEQNIANLSRKTVLYRLSASEDWIVVRPEPENTLNLKPQYKGDTLSHFTIEGMSGVTRSPRQELGPVLQAGPDSITLGLGRDWQVEIMRPTGISAEEAARIRLQQLLTAGVDAKLTTILGEPAIVRPLFRHGMTDQLTGINVHIIRADQTFPVNGEGFVLAGLRGSSFQTPDVRTPTGQRVTPVELMLAMDRMARQGGLPLAEADFVVLGVDHGALASKSAYTLKLDLFGRPTGFEQNFANLSHKPVLYQLPGDASGDWVVLHPQSESPLALRPQHKAGTLYRFAIDGVRGTTRTPRQELGPVLEIGPDSITLAMGRGWQVEIMRPAGGSAEEAAQLRLAQLRAAGIDATLTTILGEPAIVTPRGSDPLNLGLPTRVGDYLPVGDDSQSAAQTGDFKVTMSPARAQNLEVARQNRVGQLLWEIDGKARAAWGAWLPADIQSAAHTARVLGDAEFEAAYVAQGGKSDPKRVLGFADRKGGGRPLVVTVRANPAGHLAAFEDLSFAHEIVHAYTHSDFETTAGRIYLRLRSSPGANLAEGAAEYLAFKIAGPERFRSRDDGLLAYVNELIENDDLAGIQKLSYLEEALTIEEIAWQMGGDAFNKAVFGGDREALTAFVSIAMKVANQYDAPKGGDTTQLLPRIKGGTPTSGVPIPGSGDSIFPTRLWPATEAAIERGFFASPDDQYIYVFAVPRNAIETPAVLNAGDVQAYGILPAGADEVMWQPGYNATPERIAQAATVLEAFGTPTRPLQPGIPRANDILAFVVSSTPKTDLDRAGSITDIPWVLDNKTIPGPANAATYQQPGVGFKGRWGDGDRGPRAYGGVQSVLGISDAYNRLRGQVYRPGEGWVAKGSGEPNDARRIPKYAVNFLSGPKFAYQDSARGTVTRDAHNHKGTFVHPFYIHDRTAVQRLLGAANTPGIINDSTVEIQVSNQYVPYAVMRGGKWTGYTDRDTARTTVKYAPMDDWKTLRHWAELTDAEKAHIIPSITGIPTYPGSGVNPSKYLSDLLIWNYDVYPMAGELTVRAKELWTILTGRTGTTRKPLLSTDVGAMVGRDETVLLEVFEALRDAGILTSVHNDASFAEFAGDGRPTPAPGDSRFFYGLMRLLMMVGRYDMSGVPFDGRNFKLSDGDVAAILAAGPTQRPLNVIGAHFFMGNITKAAPHHFELLQMLLQHPLLEHVNLDSSWLPTAEHMLTDVQGFSELILTGRVLYGGDVLNFQTIQQLAAPWYMHQPILGRLDAAGTNQLGHDALNWYAGDALRQAYEQSKPAMDWFKYRNYRAGTSQERIDDMPPARRAGFNKWVADYEAAHPELLDPLRYADLLAKDQIPGHQAPAQQLWTPGRTSLPRIQLRSTELQDAVYRLAQGEEVDLNQIAGRTENPLLPQPPAPANQGTPITLPSRADIETFLLQDPIEDVRGLKRPDGTPYSEAAYAAGENARKTGANRGLQLLTMALTDVVDRSQAPVNAKLEVEGNQSDRSIRNIFAATFSAMVLAAAGFSGAAIASPEVRQFIEFNPHLKGALPWIVVGALFTRGAVNVFGNASRHTNRKISEAHNEQGVARPKWIEFIKQRILRYGPNSGFDPARFEGDQGIRTAMDNVIAGVGYLMESPLDLDAGETQELRHQFITTIESVLLGQVGSKLGAAQGSLDPTNFRTPSGKWISAATALAYELGLVGSIADAAIHPDHFYAYASALGAFMFATNHALGAISGHYNANWTELPLMTRLMSMGANSVVSAGAGLYAYEAASEGHYGQAAFATIASGALLFAARLGLRGEFPRPPAEMRRHPSDSIGMLRDLLERSALPGDTGQPGVSKPRRLAQLLSIGGLALIGLALTMAIDEWEKKHKKQGQPGQNPGSPPGPSQSPSVTPSPIISPTAVPTTSVSPIPTITSPAPVLPTHGRRPPP